MITRRCVLPQKVFKIVESFSKFQNFARARIIAEGDVLRRGDILISDMYLPESFIRRLLDKACELATIELLNRATHNSPIRLQTVQIGEKIVPEVFFSEINDTENFDVMNSSALL